MDVDWSLILHIFIAVFAAALAKDMAVDWMTKGGMVENIHHQLESIEELLREGLRDSRGQQ